MFDIDGLDIQAQLQALERVDCEDSLYVFLRTLWRAVDPAPWTDGWAMQAIAEHLEAVTDGELRRLCINISPRSSKSSLCSVAFPAWVWAQEHRSPTSGPGVQFLHASYANQLAMRDSVKCRRLIESPAYQKMWGSRYKLTGDQNTKSRFGNDQGGERMITSVGAGVTGEGGNCLPGWSRVSTPRGPRPIEAIKVGDEVLAFDHSRGKVAMRRVLAVQSRDAEELYAIHTFSGYTVECTGSHPVFAAGRGYVCASRLGRGDRVLLERGAHDAAASDLRPVRQGIFEATVQRAESHRAEQPGCILQSAVQPNWTCAQEHEALRYLRQAAPASTFKGLFRRVPEAIGVESTQEENLSSLQSNFRQSIQRLLQFALRRYGSFRQDARGQQFAVQGNRALFQSVQSDAQDHHRAGWASLLRLWSDREDVSPPLRRNSVIASCPSHQRIQPRQSTREPDYDVRNVPQEVPSWALDDIDRIERRRCEPIRVYDIQVEGCRNFFAGGVLVHNCIIIDDPNAANEVSSEATIQSTLDWWTGTMSTRLNDPRTGAFVIIQQRLAENDLTGHILEKNQGEWQHLCIPARYERDRAFKTSIGWEDPRTVEGELFWPERFDEEQTKNLERELGPFLASGQLQQRPEPQGGGIIKRDWWRLWEAEAFPAFDYVLAALDTAYTTKTTNDYSALTVWGVFTQGTKAVPVRAIGKDGRPTYSERSYDEMSPKIMLMNAWQERLELHELVDKVAKSCKTLKVDKLLVENKAAGISVAQEIRRVYGYEEFGVQLHDPGNQDKVARLYSVQHLYAEGCIFAPNKEWAEMVITQVGQFPTGKHDDLVDTCSMGIRHLRDLGLLTRSAERMEEVQESLRYQGREPPPLYPA